MKISILDQMAFPFDATPQSGMENVVKLAKLADQLGYHRLWYSEHHGFENIVSSAPEVVTAHVAAVTENIRIGAGGVMIPNHVPYKLAEVYKTLGVMAPGRVDFAVGRAPGGTPRSAVALRQGRTMTPDLYQEIIDTMEFLDEEKNITTDLLVAPMGVQLPEAWMLGSSGQSSLKAAELGMGYSHANFISGQPDIADLRRYKEHFAPSKFMKEPIVNSGFFAVIGETDEEADYHAKTMELYLVLLNSPMRGIYSPEYANDYPYTEIEKNHIKMMRASGRLVVGSAKKVAEFFKYHNHQFGIDEVVLASNIYDQEFKRKGFELLMEEMKK